MALISKIVKTCNACPAKWEGRLTSGEPFYIRYRWGNLTISFGPKESAIDVAIKSSPIYIWEEGGEMSSVMEYDEMIPHLDKAIKKLNSGPEDGLTLKDYEAAFNEHKRLVRELDLLLNGEGAAKQASLCDIVAQVRSEGLTFKALYAIRELDEALEHIEKDWNNEENHLGNTYPEINITGLRKHINAALT